MNCEFDATTGLLYVSTKCLKLRDASVEFKLKHCVLITALPLDFGQAGRFEGRGGGCWLDSKGTHPYTPSLA